MNYTLKTPLPARQKIFPKPDCFLSEGRLLFIRKPWAAAEVSGLSNENTGLARPGRKSAGGRVQ
ncbi:hypothetical protein [Hymenobacter daeguensis]